LFINKLYNYLILNLGRFSLNWIFGGFRVDKDFSLD